MAISREGGRTTTPPASTGGAPQDLYDVSDIRFVMREVATLTERISNLIDKQTEVNGKLERLSDKLDQRFEKLETKITDAVKPVSEDVSKLKSQATYFKGYMAALLAAAAVAAFFFHDELQHIAESVAKLGKP